MKSHCSSFLLMATTLCSILSAEAKTYLIQVEVPLSVAPSRMRQQSGLDPRFLSDRFAMTREGKRHERQSSDRFPGESNRITVYTCPEVLAKATPASTQVIIDISRQRVFLVSQGYIALETEVSTARTGKHTPRGSFQMTERVRSGKISTIYDVSMPYWMRLGSSPYGVHAGHLPGYPASAGCIRLPMTAAGIVYAKTRQGTQVKIVDRYAGPTIPALRILTPAAGEATIVPRAVRPPSEKKGFDLFRPFSNAKPEPSGSTTFEYDQYGQTISRIRI